MDKTFGVYLHTINRKYVVSNAVSNVNFNLNKLKGYKITLLLFGYPSHHALHTGCGELSFFWGIDFTSIQRKFLILIQNIIVNHCKYMKYMYIALSAFPTKTLIANNLVYKEFGAHTCLSP